MNIIHARTLSLSVGLTLVLLAAPRPVAADCGGDYVACLNEAGAIGSSEALHETDCYSDYWNCVNRQIRFY